jgi:molybdate transport system permease protein
MTFAHTIGEFGVVLMVGGSIPEETKVVSIAIYEEVEAMNYHNANVYAGILFAFSFSILLIVHLINNKSRKTTLY